MTARMIAALFRDPIRARAALRDLHAANVPARLLEESATDECDARLFENGVALGAVLMAIAAEERAAEALAIFAYHGADPVSPGELGGTLDSDSPVRIGLARHDIRVDEADACDGRRHDRHASVRGNTARYGDRPSAWSPNDPSATDAIARE